MFHFQERGEYVIECNSFHIQADQFIRCRYECFAGILFFQLVHDSLLRSDNNLFRVRLFGEFQYSTSASYKIRHRKNFGAAFRMSCKQGPGILIFHLKHIARQQVVMYITEPLPGDYLFFGKLCGIACEIAVGNHQNGVRVKTVDYAYCICGGAAYVAVGLGFRR